MSESFPSEISLNVKPSELCRIWSRWLNEHPPRPRAGQLANAHVNPHVLQAGHHAQGGTSRRHRLRDVIVGDRLRGRVPAPAGSARQRRSGAAKGGGRTDSFLAAHKLHCFIRTSLIWLQEFCCEKTKMQHMPCAAADEGYLVGRQIKGCEGSNRCFVCN